MAGRSNDKLVRAVGVWGLVLFCINAVVGSGRSFAGRGL